MKIILARTSGFCMGVRRAVEMVLDAPRKHRSPIYTFGPLIHNPDVLALLEEKGIRILGEIPEKGTGTVLVRAHGVPPDTHDRLRKAGFEVIDATCPRVIKVQSIIKRYTRSGHHVIILGDPDHPEVAGLLGCADGRGHVVRGLSDLEPLPPFEKAILVAQTTQNLEAFEGIKAWLEKRHPHYQVFDTICDSTIRRQVEVRRLAAEVDAVIVVGGRSSGNTQRLAEIARGTGKPAFHIESEADIPAILGTSLAAARTVGITAGASTPNWIIKRVYRALEAFPFTRRPGWRKSLYRVQRFLLLTNSYLSLGAGALCAACAKLLGTAEVLPHALIAMLYVQSMHILNHLTGNQSDHYNDPGRAHFYRKHRLPLTALALAAGAAGLLIAFFQGSTAFRILLGISLLGLSYNLRFLPRGLFAGRVSRLRDVPGSKTFLIAAAWGVVTVLLPAFSQAPPPPLQILPVLLFAAGSAFARTVLCDILDMQGDRIVGKETLPLLLGERRSLRLLKIVLAGLSVLLGTLGFLGPARGLGFALLVCPAFLFWVLLSYERSYMIPGTRMEFLVETHFLLAGAVTFLWWAWDGGG